MKCAYRDCDRLIDEEYLNPGEIVMRAKPDKVMVFCCQEHFDVVTR